MPVDLGVLDNIISLVVVILLLSMVVQSLQTFVKKLSKFKSRQIKKSLEKLFERVEASAPATGAATAESVMKRFEELGRTTALGNHAIESISKADLSKVVASIESSAIVPETIKPPVTEFFNALTQAQTAINALAAIRLPDAAVAQLTAVRTQLAPIVAHVTQLFKNGQLDPTLVVRDVMTVGQFDTTTILSGVASLQAQIEQAAAADPTNVPLRDAAKAANDLAVALGNVHVKLTQVVARLRERISAIETWYDTVMQGFEERYARHMRSWAFALSLVVTIALNGDVFQIYRRLATDPLAQKRVLLEYETIAAGYKQQLAEATAAKATLPPTASQAQRDAADETIQSISEKLENGLEDAAQSYPALGIEPFEWNDITPWTPIGWVFMAFLLSMGAPFWQDALESLFGLKNLLRDKTETNKVEQQSGQGATKT